MKPILFLDLDGVCNTAEHRALVGARYPGWTVWTPRDKPGPHPSELLSAEHIQRLNRLVGHVDFVLSTGWRKRFSKDEIEGLLRGHGWTGTVHDTTPYRMSSSKASEILMYLRDEREAGRERPYVAIDDDPLWNVEPLILTDDATGLTDEHIDQVAGLLGITL